MRICGEICVLNFGVVLLLSRWMGKWLAIALLGVCSTKFVRGAIPANMP